jgi:putative methyltransferase (TIGR04325 family)
VFLSPILISGENTRATNTPLKGARMLLKLKAAFVRHGFFGIAMSAVRRAHSFLPRAPDRRFRGAFGSYQEAMASVRPGLLAGYDNDAIVDVSFEEMSRILPSDARVLVLLGRLLPDVKYILDAGGHMGTKYRAFRDRLDLDNNVFWIIWDTPAAVRAGRKRAVTDGLTALLFVEDIAEAPPTDLMFCSGLLQYIDIPFADLIGQLVTKPRHLILNKVATRDGPTVVMLERFGDAAEVPYQIRNREEFVGMLDALSYDVVEEWVLPEFSHVIPDAPQLGASTSRGYYAKLRA